MNSLLIINSAGGTPWWLAVGFVILVILMLAIDLGFFSKKSDLKVSNRDAVLWSIIWILVAIAFAVLIYFAGGKDQSE